MLSSNNLNLLPSASNLKKICKAISVLDALLCSDWEFRYYSYNAQWSESEEFFEMRNGEGDHMLILFQKDSVVINGFSIDCEQPLISDITQNLPAQFKEFIFGEPVKSIGTTFCIWKIEADAWSCGALKNFEDNSETMLAVFDSDPNTYINWAKEYHGDYFITSADTFDLVSKIYQGETLTREIVSSIAADIEDWEQLELDLKEISYNYSF
jgi:hypothetical protein